MPSRKSQNGTPTSWLDHALRRKVTEPNRQATLSPVAEGRGSKKRSSNRWSWGQASGSSSQSGAGGYTSLSRTKSDLSEKGTDSTTAGRHPSAQFWSINRNKWKRASYTSSSSADPTITSASSRASSIFAPRNPFNLLYGRRYCKDIPYPLPSDLPELQRQNLSAILTTTVFGKPICSPIDPERPPRAILDVGCGSGYFSSTCHDYFVSLGIEPPVFTGLDVIPLAPDLNKQGIKWRFVGHDFRKVPLPFEDGEFDIVLIKDMTLAKQSGPQGFRLFKEFLRILAPQGTLEFQETDHIFRRILPNPAPPPNISMEERLLVKKTGCYYISPITSFAPCKNRFLKDFNLWMHSAMEQRKMSPTPSTILHGVMLQEDELLEGYQYKRVAIPLGFIAWEEETEGIGGTLRCSRQQLNSEQVSIRKCALDISVQFIQALEPILREANGKSNAEWSAWWNAMMIDLYEMGGCSAGEVLEYGAWWARKKG